MAELLRVVRRGLTCSAVKVIGVDEGAFLRCDLPPKHDGPLHYDETDRVWWFADA